MIKRMLIVMATLALGLASAKSYSLTLSKPAVLAGAELRPGNYKIDVDGSKVVVQRGSQKVESAVKVEQADSKFSVTSVRYVDDGGKNRIEEIRLGGTNLRLVFE
jgi:hypothetical protein